MPAKTLVELLKIPVTVLCKSWNTHTSSKNRGIFAILHSLHYGRLNVLRILYVILRILGRDWDRLIMGLLNCWSLLTFFCFRTSGLYAALLAFLPLQLSSWHPISCGACTSSNDWSRHVCFGPLDYSFSDKSLRFHETPLLGISLHFDLRPPLCSWVFLNIHFMPRDDVDDWTT